MLKLAIEFYENATGNVIPAEDTYDTLFVMNNMVWQDNGYGVESQEPYVTFPDFIEPRMDLGWRITTQSTGV